MKTDDDHFHLSQSDAIFLVRRLSLGHSDFNNNVELHHRNGSNLIFRNAMAWTLRDYLIVATEDMGSFVLSLKHLSRYSLVDPRNEAIHVPGFPAPYNAMPEVRAAFREWDPERLSEQSPTEYDSYADQAMWNADPGNWGDVNSIANMIASDMNSFRTGTNMRTGEESVCGELYSGSECVVIAQKVLDLMGRGNNNKDKDKR